MSNTFWVLESFINGQFYHGDGRLARQVEYAMRYATEKHAQEHVEHMIRIGYDIDNLEAFKPVEYAVEYKRVIR